MYGNRCQRPGELRGWNALHATAIGHDRFVGDALVDSHFGHGHKGKSFRSVYATRGASEKCILKIVFLD
jgi:hypothetical protein